MIKLETLNDNTLKDIPVCPVITYVLVADMGNDGTKTLYECGLLTEINNVVSEICNGYLDRPNLDLTYNELENIETLYINIALTASSLDITKYSQEQIAEANLKSYKVVREDKYVLEQPSIEDIDMQKLAESVTDMGVHYLIKNIIDSIKDTDSKFNVLNAIKEYYTE